MSRTATQVLRNERALDSEQLQRSESRPVSRHGAELLGVEDACRLLGVHRNTLYRLIHHDDLPALRLTRGGRWRFPKQGLLDWLESRQARRPS